MAVLPSVQRALEYNALLAQCADEALAAGDVTLAVRYQRRLGRSLMLLLELAAECGASPVKSTSLPYVRDAHGELERAGGSKREGEAGQAEEPERSGKSERSGGPDCSGGHDHSGEPGEVSDLSEPGTPGQLSHSP